MSHAMFQTTLNLLRQDLIRSRDRLFHIGFKLVRGAYMDQVIH